MESTRAPRHQQITDENDVPTYTKSKTTATTTTTYKKVAAFRQKKQKASGLGGASRRVALADVSGTTNNNTSKNIKKGGKGIGKPERIQVYVQPEGNKENISNNKYTGSKTHVVHSEPLSAGKRQSRITKSRKPLTEKSNSASRRKLGKAQRVRKTRDIGDAVYIEQQSYRFSVIEKENEVDNVNVTSQESEPETESEPEPEPKPESESEVEEKNSKTELTNPNDTEVETDVDSNDDERLEFSYPAITEDDISELAAVTRQFYREDGVLDEDDEDTFDVAMVAEYSEEIFSYMRQLEEKMRPDPLYMDKQDELEWEMRSILVDWLVQVHLRFNLLPETLFLAINYVDRFLSKRRVSLSKFQLVGAVALFTAAKVEEINCPSIEEIAFMVDHAYTIDELLHAERFMIDILDFEMCWPGPMSFLRRTSKADDYDLETRSLAKYFLEITIMDPKYVAAPPSWLAAAAHLLSRKMLGRGDWTPAHVYYSGYTAKQLQPLAKSMLESCRDPETHHKAIFEKYQERRFRRASTFVQEWMALVGNV